MSQVILVLPGHDWSLEERNATYVCSWVANNCQGRPLKDDCLKRALETRRPDSVVGSRWEWWLDWKEGEWSIRQVSTPKTYLPNPTPHPLSYSQKYPRRLFETALARYTFLPDCLRQESTISSHPRRWCILWERGIYDRSTEIERRALIL